MTLVLDPGSSRIKGFVSIQGDRNEVFEPICRPFWMGANSVELTQSIYEQRLDLPTGGTSLNNGLVNCQGRFYHIGGGAGNPGNERKYESAIAKLLNALGYFAVSEGLEDVGLTVGLLLPFDEYSDRELVQQVLEREVPRFVYNGALIDAYELDGLKIVPEGYGLFREVRSPNMACFSAGHRDASYLHVEDHSPVPGECKTFAGGGFRKFLSYLDFPVKDEIKVSSAVFNAGSRINQKALSGLIQSGTKEESSRLQSAIAKAREQYVLELSQWLKQTTLKDVSVVAFGGGAGWWLKRDLNQMHGTVNWCEGLLGRLCDRFDLPKDDRAYCSMDVFGFAETLGV